VIDLDEDKLFREDLRVDSFLLNVIWDSVMLYDPTGRLGALREGQERRQGQTREVAGEG